MMLLCVTGTGTGTGIGAGADMTFVGNVCIYRYPGLYSKVNRLLASVVN